MLKPAYYVITYSDSAPYHKTMLCAIRELMNTIRWLNSQGAIIINVKTEYFFE